LALEQGREVSLPRLEQARSEILARGWYRQSFEELEFTARLAWRNNRRCIGRRYWQTLEVADAQAWARLQMSMLIVPHERIALTAEELGFQRLLRTGSGDEALFAAIQSRP
jgi:nitric oxide synthase oxygenase domain/subunit